MVTAIIQARTSSKRLPGKVLKILHDKTVIGHIITRLKRCVKIDEIILATSTETSDDELIEECVKYGVKYFRGSLSDVLDRMYNAAANSGAEHIARICGDTPLLDSEQIDNAIEYYLSGDFDMVGIKSGIGGFEIFSAEILKEAWETTEEEYQREHVTPYIYETGRVSYYLSRVDCTKYRYTLDTQEDWEFIQKVYDNLYKDGQYFDIKSVCDFLDTHPEIAEINKDVQQTQIPSKK